MLLDLVWNDHPPVTRFLFSLSMLVGLLVSIEPELETKMYLMPGCEIEVWRYVTNLMYGGKMSMRFLVCWAAL